jgi:membrane-bound ClpP family serine protease
MSPTTGKLTPMLRHGGWSRAVGLLALFLLALPAPADAPPDAPPVLRTVEGMVFQVPTNITSETTRRLKSLLQGPLERFKSGAIGKNSEFVLVLDFNPGNQRSDCDSFGVCADLAEYLLSLRKEVFGMKTVAFVHADVKRHSVLPVLACSEIVISEDPVGRLGPVVPATKPLDDFKRSGYARIIGESHANRDALRKMYEAVDGNTVSYTFAQAKPFGICSQTTLNTLDAVLATYKVPRVGPRRVLDRIVCWRIPVEGDFSRKLKEQVKRRVERALRGRANVIVFELRCGNGESEHAHELGNYLARINEKRGDNPVETIAFVTKEAHNNAAFVAFGCNKIIMQAEPPEGGESDKDADNKWARLGDFGPYLDKHPSLAGLNKEREDVARRVGADPRRLAALEVQHKQRVRELEGVLSKNLADIATLQRYPALLAEGMARRDMTIRLVQGKKVAGKQDPGAREFLLQRDFEDQKDDWASSRVIKNEGEYLTLPARQAKELGIASECVKDFEGLCEAEGIPFSEVRTPGSDWLEGLGDFLRNPWVSVLLVMLGITCLILELKMPGVGLPGVIAAICFVLFFWSHSQLAGQITWLAILLFVLGLILIGLEIFVLPGFGVAGISGILLVLCGLGLVAYGHWPRSSGEWVGLGQKIGPFGISLLGALISVALVVRYLPHIPVLNRLMHRPAEETEGVDDVPDNPVHAEMAALLGAIGVAATPLRPAGKTQFGDTFVDVVAEGGYIMPGARVQVVEVEGNRVVVKEV